MTQGKGGRSGRVFFAFAVLVIFTAILGTALGANDLRNLNIVLARFGYPPVKLEHLFPFAEPTAGDAKGGHLPVIRVVKGIRLPSPTIRVPRYARANLDGIPTTFVRSIRMNPRRLCETLRANGFPDIAWTASAVDGQGSECSSFLPIGNGAPTGTGPAKRPEVAAPKPPPKAQPGDDVDPDNEPLMEAPPDEPPPPQQSSVFVLLKGDLKGRVLTFRVKFNIELESDRAAVIQAGSRAVEAFLQQVRWQDDGDMLRQIAALQEFDRDEFGSHIAFKRERVDLPRFNFLARKSEKPRRKISDAFFDPSAWLPLSDADPTLWMPRSALRAFTPPPFPRA
ncbi:hypothetical protein ASG25_19105 [Rhizobium sp. Leaf384]|uniref:DUF6030 family protein n=1 Tax=unclassified Rhizobium TaxID=2613769 RepID=UPI0007131749|nr:MULTISPECIES: DUF6030 family protein [unclassified Rhizobium]KQS76298.1 hypothetical protein ASG25_19105 [Rhizobium sp. Leaf384]KQS78433.1 hypothetical protein ASG58_08725 [Rhizobium sp. Leaf383]